MKKICLLITCIFIMQFSFCQSNNTNEITWDGGDVKILVLNGKTGAVIIDTPEGREATVSYDNYYKTLHILYKSERGLVIWTLKYQRSENDYLLYYQEDGSVVYKVFNSISKDGILLLQYAKSNSDNDLCFIKVYGLKKT